LKSDITLGMSRYFIAIIPPRPIFDDVQALKTYFHNKYESSAALRSPPHITLRMPFLWRDDEEDFLISSLSDFAVRRKPTTIELSNFSSFAPKVIFIAVSENESLRRLQLELSHFCRSKLKLFDTESEGLPYRPHLTLAFRDLKKEMFEHAWENFSRRKYAATFTMDKITLLKLNSKIWLPYRDFHF
jgi:2'-5' RNA ligase